MGLIFIFVSLLAAIGGCAVRSSIPADLIWPEHRSMARLERDVRALCDDLVQGIEPGSVFIAWQDNLHPHSPMLSEAYVVSMFERRLIGRGFTVSVDEGKAVYSLMLIMTPSRESLLVLASLRKKDAVVATKEAHFMNGPEKWNKELGSYRYRTGTKIPLGCRP